MAVKDKALKRWMQSPELIDKSIDLLGKEFSPREIAALALFGKKVGGDNIKMDMVPVIETDGASSLHLDKSKLRAKLKALHMDSDLKVGSTEGQ